MPTYDYAGRVINANAMIQEHLNNDGSLELVIRRDGKSVLEFHPSKSENTETPEVA